MTIKIKGSLTNITTGEIILINEKCIKNKNKITYMLDNIKHTLIATSDSIFLKRENNDFINVINLNRNKSFSTYTLKENNLEITIDILLKEINNTNKNINFAYEVTDSEETYIYNIELRNNNEY